jgi:hypothetical protein
MPRPDDDLFWQLLDERHNQVVALLTELRDKVAVQNGRVATLERKVAILEDRSPGRVGMLAGGTVAGAVVVLVTLIQWWADR